MASPHVIPRRVSIRDADVNPLVRPALLEDRGRVARSIPLAEAGPFLRCLLRSCGVPISTCHGPCHPGWQPPMPTRMGSGDGIP